MKAVLIFGVAMLALTACDTTEASKTDALRADCDVLATDPEGQDEFADMGTDGAGFCDCLVKYVEAKPAEDQVKMKLVMDRVADGMEETGEGAEEVVGGLMRDVALDEENGANIADGIALVGQAIDDIGEGFDETGACPVS